MFKCLPLSSHGTKDVSSVTNARKALIRAIAAKAQTRRSTVLSTTPRSLARRDMASVRALAAFKAKIAPTGN